MLTKLRNQLETSLAHHVHRIMMAQLTIKNTVHSLERIAHLLQQPLDVLLDATPRRAQLHLSTVAILAPFGPSSLASRLVLGLVLPRRSAGLLPLVDQDRV